MDITLVEIYLRYFSTTNYSNTVLLFLMSPPDVAESHETPLIHFISYLFSPLLPSSLSFHSVRYECHKPFFHNNNNKN